MIGQAKNREAAQRPLWAHLVRAVLKWEVIRAPAGDRRQVRVALRVLKRPEPTRAELPAMTTSVSTAVPLLNRPATPARLPRMPTRSSERMPSSFRMPPPTGRRRWSGPRRQRSAPDVEYAAPGVALQSQEPRPRANDRGGRRVGHDQRTADDPDRPCFLAKTAGANVIVSGPGWLLA